jgi:hypothetical protein
MSHHDAAWVEAQIVEILGPEVGPRVARAVIERAIPAYANDDDVRQFAHALFSRKDRDPRIRLRRGPRKLTSRDALAVRLAIILRQAGVPQSKTHSITSEARRPRRRSKTGDQFGRVLRVVFQAVGIRKENIPEDMFDVIEPALKEMDYQLQHPAPGPLALLDPNRRD